MSFATSPGLKGVAGRTFGPIISYPALSRHTGTVIMLHGLGDTGNGWSPVAPELGMDHIRWVFPTAPTRPISVNMGMSMPGWFDIDHLDEPSFMKMMKGHHGFDPEGVQESVSYVEHLIEMETRVHGIPPERIVLGGFSQGGHIALKSLVNGKKIKLAGLMALSTWLEPQHIELDQEITNTPVFYGHGASDPLIPPMVAQLSVQHLLENHKFSDLKFNMYPGMQHSTCYEEMRDMKEFLQRVIPPEPQQAVTEEDISSMSVRELKHFLQSRGVDPSKFLEKSELLNEAKRLV